MGPVRLVGQRLAAPGSVKIAAFTAFFFAGLLGLALVGLSELWVMIPIGAAAILAAWFYTGGARPYGYLGLGEVFVFVFFGLVATLGTMATMTALTAGAWWGAIGVGALASAILVANNLRDIPTDREHGKRTLAVRMGERGTRTFYVVLVAVAFVMTGLASFTSPWALLAVLAAPFVVRRHAGRRRWRDGRGPHPGARGHRSLPARLVGAARSRPRPRQDLTRPPALPPPRVEVMPPPLTRGPVITSNRACAPPWASGCASSGCASSASGRA